jgi:transcription elongation factor GreA
MRVKLTRAGLEKLQAELKHLKEVRRPEIIQEIAVAREKGDLRENAEYDAAREAQGHLEKRIHDLDMKLMNVDIIDGQDIDATKAYLGAAVKLKDLVKDKEIVYMLVSKEEADLKHQKISVDSPVGRAILGKSVGDKVEVVIPAGRLQYEILEISR